MTQHTRSVRAPLLWRRLGTASAIYGTIVYAALIAAGSDHDGHATDLDELLAFSAITLVAFFIAHVFAGTFAHYGRQSDEPGSLRESMRESLVEAIGMLEAAVIPSVILLLGVLGVIDPEWSVSLALQSAVLILGLLGYVAMAIRRAPWWARIVVAFSAALLGALIIVLEAILH